jgi:serine/threonine protein kinase
MLTLDLSTTPRYRVLRPLGHGAISKVFVARDEELNRTVALKELRSRYADSPAAQARLLFEAEITAGLEHPGVVPVYGRGRYPDGRVYFTMRLVRGESLAEAIEECLAINDQAERARVRRRLIERLIDVCYTMSHVHRRGVIHRDLSPRNIMFGLCGEAVIIDWGLARLIDQPAGDDEIEEPLRPTSARDLHGTRMGKVIGTPRFISPEQAAGRRDRQGPASDVFGLGAILYAILTGRPPFDGPDDDAVLEQARLGQFPAPRTVASDLSRAFESICLRAMTLEPEARYPSPLALGDDIEEALADGET